MSHTVEAFSSREGNGLSLMVNRLLLFHLTQKTTILNEN